MEWIEIAKWLVGISVVIISLSYTIRHFKIVRTISYIERFNTASMIETRAIVKDWAKLDIDEQLNKLEEDSELYYKVNLIYNLITEIGISYQYRIINRKITCELFDPLIPILYEKIQPFLYFSTKEGKSLGYYAERINSVILKYRHKNPKQYKPILLPEPEKKEIKIPKKEEMKLKPDENKV